MITSRRDFLFSFFTCGIVLMPQENSENNDKHNCNCVDFPEIIHSSNVGPPSCSMVSYNAPEDVHKEIFKLLKLGEDQFLVLESYEKMGTSWDSNISSAVFIKSEGLILTNNHSFSSNQDNNRRIVIIWSPEYEGKKLAMEAEIVNQSLKNDLALLRVIPEQSVCFPAVNFALENPKIGQQVFSITNPIGLSFSFGSAFVSGLRKGQEINIRASKDLFDPDIIIIQLSGGNNSFGTSGGPLFNVNGLFCGIIDASLNQFLADGRAPNGEKISLMCSHTGFAVSIETIREWLREIRVVV